MAIAPRQPPPAARRPRRRPASVDWQAV